jgi:polyisoprenoid-binding protein YceI
MSTTSSTSPRPNTATPERIPTAPETFVIDADHSEVGFSVRHLLGRTRGRFARFEGEIQLDRRHPEASYVRFQVDPASIDTRQPERDAHLRSGDFFDVERFPLIRFESTRILAQGGDRYRVEGQLWLRGVTKTLALDVRWLGVARDPWGGERAGFTTEVVLDRKEFGMVWNTALDTGGFILGDEVTLTIDLETILKAQASAA